MTDQSVEAGKASQITPNPLVPIINIASNLPVGYFSAGYLNTSARIGLAFFHADRVWKILHVSVEEIVFALPSKDVNLIIQSNNPGVSREIVKSEQKKSSATPSHEQPTPLSEPIIVESYKNYILIHAPFGIPINTTLRLGFDAMLTEQDLIRDSYNDGTRILIQTPVELAREEVESIISDLFYITPHELDRLILKAIDARFPSVVLKENREPKKSQLGNTLKEELRTKLVVRQAKATLKRLHERKIMIALHVYTFRPTPQARELIDEYQKTTAAESDKIIKENVIRFRRSIERESAELLCMNCLSSQSSIRILDLKEKPTCMHCGSRLLALPVVSAQTIASLLHKKKSSKLNPVETNQLAGTRRTADLVLSYGKRAIIALSVTGIGPQTASSILASMIANDSEFFYELLKARIHYLATRELWDRKQKSAISLSNRVRFNI